MPITSERRITSIDTLKVVAIFGVICLHTGPFGDPQYTGSPFRVFSLIVNQVSRFAVPFFFLASGFFFGRSLRQGVRPQELFLKYFQRLFIVFIVWSLIYALAPRDVSSSLPLWELMHVQLNKTIHWIAENPLTFLLQGTRVHLWFLPALIFSLFILTVFITAKLEGYVIYFSTALYAIHLLSGPYSHTSLGIPFNLTTLNTPLTGAVFTIIGWSLAYGQIPRPIFTYLLLIGGFVLHNLEAIYLHKHYNSDLSEHHYLIGTVPFSLGMLLLCLTYPQFGKDTFWPTLGKLTLGIYVSHFLALDIVLPLKAWMPGPLWELSFPLFVYSFALSMTLVLARLRYCRPIVM